MVSAVRPPQPGAAATLTPMSAAAICAPSPPGPLAQLVEQRTLNPLADGSSPSWPTRNDSGGGRAAREGADAAGREGAIDRRAPVQFVGRRARKHRRVHRGDPGAANPRRCEPSRNRENGQGCLRERFGGRELRAGVAGLVSRRGARIAGTCFSRATTPRKGERQSHDGRRNGRGARGDVAAAPVVTRG